MTFSEDDDEDSGKVKLSKEQKKMAENLADLIKGKGELSDIPTIPKLRNIQKRILVPGRPPNFESCRAPGGGFDYPKETKFIFHYKIKYADNDTVLDDTRKYSKTMEVYSGKEFQLDWWESCLGTMFLGEVASFTVPPERLFNFPAVNRKLRDYMTNNHAAHKKSCCAGMALSNHEKEGISLFGYPDLDEYMKNPKALEFIFDLISIEVPEQNKKDTYIMNSEERKLEAVSLKDSATKAFNQNELDKALCLYQKSLQLFEQVITLERQGDAEWNELNCDISKVNLNIAQIFFRKKDFQNCVTFASSAIDKQANYGKAFYRRGKAYFQINDYQEAINDLLMAQKLMPELREDIEKEVIQAKSAHAEATEATRSFMINKLKNINK